MALLSFLIWLTTILLLLFAFANLFSPAQVNLSFASTPEPFPKHFKRKHSRASEATWRRASTAHYLIQWTHANPGLFIAVFTKKLPRLEILHCEHIVDIKVAGYLCR
jgi:hypothetical protein